MQPLIKALLAIVPICAGFRAAYCIIKIVTDGEQEKLYKRRLVNLLIYAGIAEAINSLIWLIYYKYFYL